MTPFLDYIKEQAGYPHSFLGVNNKREGRRPLSYGNGFLSFFPISHVENTAFGDAVLGEKGFLYAEFAVPGGHLPVVNLHLDYKSRVRRIEQIERIIEYLKKRSRENGDNMGYSPIVCGDFNSRSRKVNDAVQYLFSYLRDQCAYELHPEKGRTFPSYLPIHGLNFVFTPPECRVLHCEILKSYVSDHRPVLVDLEMVY